MESLFESFGWLHFWLIMAVAMTILEIVTVAFFALPFALGALVTAFFAWLEMPLAGQIGVFAVSSFLMMFVIQKTVKKYFMGKKGVEVRSGTDRLIGMSATVLKRIEGRMTRGEIKVEGEIWSAVAENDEHYGEGERVKVVAVEGAKLIVEKA